MLFRCHSLVTTLALIVLLPILGHAGVVVYTTDASFLTAAGGGVTSQSFETAVLGTPTTVNFSGGTFSCTGSTYCPGFFGISTLFADTGSQSVFFATPDTATFTFSSPISAFGVAIGGAGDVAPITLVASLSNGDTANALTNYTGAFDVFITNRQFFGIIDTTSFTSIAFTGNNSGDGIFLDTMYYGNVTTAVPEPASALLLSAGFAILGLRWRRKSHASRSQQPDEPQHSGRAAVPNRSR